MAPRRLHKPTHLIFDFDGTLTTKDTMAILGTLPIDPPISWEAISEAYMEDYRRYKETPFAWKTYDEGEYSAWLNSRKSVEQRSAQRVQDAGFFRGVTLDNVCTTIAAALEDGRLEFRDGWLDLFSIMLFDTNGVKISIISVNWSGTFIRRALREAARRSSHESKDVICRYIESMEIHANEIDGLSRPAGSSGTICHPDGLDIQTSHDKLSRVPKVSSASIDQAHPLVVYLGDSSTDFDALLRAHTGIWICDVGEEDYEYSFKKSFSPFGRFVPRPIWQQQGLENSLCWSPDFHHVLAALTRPP